MEKKIQSISQSQTCTTKVTVILVVSCPSDPLQLSESQQNHCIWDVCSANQCDAPKTAMPAASIGQQNGPISSPWQHLTTCSTTNASKWMNWAMKFRLIHHIHLSSCWPATTSSNILTSFCRENASTASRRQKMLSKSLSNSEAQIFMLQE